MRAENDQIENGNHIFCVYESVRAKAAYFFRFFLQMKLIKIFKPKKSFFKRFTKFSLCIK